MIDKDIDFLDKCSMIILKRFLFRICFLCEVIIFMYFFIFGQNGILILKGQRDDNQIIIMKNKELLDVIEKLKYDINQFETNPFYREKFAREQLYMAHCDEEIFIPS